MLEQSVIERFWAKTKKSVGCWEWMASRDSSGYGTIGVGSRGDGTRRTLSAHRLSWRLHFGSIPNGFHVLHHCDNPSCVNPAHLWLGTHRENVEDSRRKGRRNRPVGVKNGRAKLDALAVKAIRGDPRIARLVAADYGVSKSAICDIKSGRRGRWAHLA